MSTITENIANIRAQMNEAAKKAGRDPSEILLCAATKMNDADRVKEATAIDRLFSALHVNRYLEDRIRSAILDEETIADTASPELADIRRSMRVAATKGRQILQRIISSPSYAKVLQEALITQRDGRFVVPVKAECKGSIHQSAVNGDHAAVYKPDFDTGSVDIERTGNHFLIHNSVLLNLFLFSRPSGL